MASDYALSVLLTVSRRVNIKRTMRLDYITAAAKKAPGAPTKKSGPAVMKPGPANRKAPHCGRDCPLSLHTSRLGTAWQVGELDKLWTSSVRYVSKFKSGISSSYKDY